MTEIKASDVQLVERCGRDGFPHLVRGKNCSYTNYLDCMSAQERRETPEEDKYPGKELGSDAIQVDMETRTCGVCMVKYACKHFNPDKNAYRPGVVTGPDKQG